MMILLGNIYANVVLSVSMTRQRIAFMMVPYALCLMYSAVFVILISSSIINAAEIYKHYIYIIVYMYPK